jgi:hypothetical protein
MLSGCSTIPGRIETPDLSFPRFPDPFRPDGSPVPVLEGETVKVPVDYWKRIVEYVIDVEKVREQYEAWKAVYGAE